MKRPGAGHIWIAALGLLIAVGGIAWAVTARRHVRLYSTAFLAVGCRLTRAARERGVPAAENTPASGSAR